MAADPGFRDRIRKAIMSLRRAPNGMTEEQVSASGKELKNLPAVEQLVAASSDRNLDRGLAVCALIHQQLRALRATSTDERWSWKSLALEYALDIDVSEPWGGALVSRGGERLLKQRRQAFHELYKAHEKKENERSKKKPIGNPSVRFENEVLSDLVTSLLALTAWPEGLTLTSQPEAGIDPGGAGLDELDDTPDQPVDDEPGAVAADLPEPGGAAESPTPPKPPSTFPGRPTYAMSPPEAPRGELAVSGPNIAAQPILWVVVAVALLTLVVGILLLGRETGGRTANSPVVSVDLRSTEPPTQTPFAPTPTPAAAAIAAAALAPDTPNEPTPTVSIEVATPAIEAPVPIEPTSTALATATPEPTAAPTSTPMPDPTETPTPPPTATPEPTVAPTATPTPRPTATASPPIAQEVRLVSLEPVGRALKTTEEARGFYLGGAGSSVDLVAHWANCWLRGPKTGDVEFGLGRQFTSFQAQLLPDPRSSSYGSMRIQFWIDGEASPRAQYEITAFDQPSFVQFSVDGAQRLRISFEAACDGGGSADEHFVTIAHATLRIE